MTNKQLLCFHGNRGQYVITTRTIDVINVSVLNCLSL